jgi:RNAse (barnase) inhibitor barstar
VTEYRLAIAKKYCQKSAVVFIANTPFAHRACAVAARGASCVAAINKKRISVFTATITTNHSSASHGNRIDTMKNAIHKFHAETTLVLDLKGVRSKKALMETLGTALKLPKHYGQNWDAFTDCIMDADWAKATSYTIIVHDSAGAAKRFGEDWDTFVDILEEACEWWGERDKAFAIVMA